MYLNFFEKFPGNPRFFLNIVIKLSNFIWLYSFYSFEMPWSAPAPQLQIVLLPAPLLNSTMKDKVTMFYRKVKFLEYVTAFRKSKNFQLIGIRARYSKINSLKRFPFTFSDKKPNWIFTFQYRENKAGIMSGN